MLLVIALLLSGGKMEVARGGIAYKSGIPDYIRKVNHRITATHATEIAQAIYKYSVAYGMDPRIVAAVISVESSFNADAVGSSGEVGLMQLHPKYHYAQNGIDNNISVGVRYLAGIRDTHQFYFGDLRYLELYNRGPFAKEPKKFPYTKKVLHAYAQLGGHVEGQRGHVQPVKVGRTNHRRLVSQAD